MWILVRADADTSRFDPSDGITTLAASPDTGDRGDPWRWSVRIGPGIEHSDDGGTARRTLGEGTVAESTVIRRDGNGLEVLTDPAFVTAHASAYDEGGAVGLTRKPGSQLVIVPLAGQALVADAHGPWHRELAAHDVFIVEGEALERLRLTPSSPPSCSIAVHLVPVGDEPLRWVP